MTAGSSPNRRSSANTSMTNGPISRSSQGDSFGRAQMRLWTKQLDEGLHPAVGTLSFCVAFRHQWLARPAEDRAKWLANIPQPERRQRLQSTLELGLDSPFFLPAFERYH